MSSRVKLNKVLALLREQQQGAQAIGDAIGCDVKFAHSLLSCLVDAGAVRRVGTPRHRLFRYIPKQERGIANLPHWGYLTDDRGLI